MEFHFLKINVVIPLLEIVYGLLSLVVMVITRGLRPLVITITTRDNNPYTFSKSGITSHYFKMRLLTLCHKIDNILERNVQDNDPLDIKIQSRYINMIYLLCYSTQTRNVIL